MNNNEIIEGIKKFDDWEWEYKLGDITKKPDNSRHEILQKLKIEHIMNGIRANLGISHNETKPLKGLRVLDVGSGEGVFSVAAKEYGADYVLGLEPREEKIEQAEFICRAKQLQSIEFKKMRIMEIDKKLGEFDVVFFIGVLYVMEKPFEAINKLSEVAKNILLIDTELVPVDYPILAAKESLPHLAYNTFDSGLTFTPSAQAVSIMLKYSGFDEPKILKPVNKKWKENTYTRHYITGHRGTFVTNKSSKQVKNRLWPKGALHPPNRVHSALFKSVIKPSFYFVSFGNEIRMIFSKILNFFKKH